MFSLHYLCINLVGGRVLPSPQETYLVKAFLDLSLFEKFAKNLTSRISRINAHACRISTPRQGVEIFENGVGVDCLLLVGRLAMPSNK